MTFPSCPRAYSWDIIAMSPDPRNPSQKSIGIGEKCTSMIVIRLADIIDQSLG